MDYIGFKYLDNSKLYINSPQYHIDMLSYVIADRINIATLLGNVFMLQGSLVPNFGSNGPLWSLADEWWYYIAFAVVAIFILSKATWYRVICIVIITALFIILSDWVLAWMAIWSLGVLSWRYWRSHLPKPHPLMGVLVFTITLVLSRLSHSSENQEFNSLLFSFGHDVILGVGYSVLLISMLGSDRKPLFPQIHAELANFSYSLYLSYFPALIFIVSFAHFVLKTDFSLQISVGAFGYAILTSILLILYAIGFYSLTEAHTDRVRRLVEPFLVAVRCSFSRRTRLGGQKI